MSEDKKIASFPGLKTGTREMLSRIVNGLGDTFGGRRNLYSAFGYANELSYAYCLRRYQRLGIISRIVNAYPDAIWTRTPQIIVDNKVGKLNSEFNFLDRKFDLYHYLNRADRLASLGKYSTLMIGFSDVKNNDGMKNPVKYGSEIIYFQAYGYDDCLISTYETNASLASFGMPKTYKLKVDEKLSIEVHADRILHIVDNPLNNDIIGFPLVWRIWNMLDDVEKVVGGSAEMFWLNGRRGLHINIDKDVEFSEEARKALRTEVEDYQNELSRVLRTKGVSVHDLGVGDVNPGPVFNVIMSMISITTGIPQRIFIGSEQGKLASEQDRSNWSQRVLERRSSVSEPKILRPLIHRLQRFGVLSEGEFGFQWPQAFMMSPLERAQTAAQQARAATNLSRAMKEMARPIEGVDYPMVRNVMNGSRIAKINAIEDAKKLPTNLPTKDDVVTDNVVPKLQLPKPEKILIKMEELLSIKEARAIIYSFGELKTEGDIDGISD
jgi:hypothetical protein